MSITESDIKGLIIEVRTFAELMTELPRVASDLLELNHGLTDEEIDKARLHIMFKFEKNAPPQSMRGYERKVVRLLKARGFSVKRNPRGNHVI